MLIISKAETSRFANWNFYRNGYFNRGSGLQIPNRGDKEFFNVTQRHSSRFAIWKLYDKGYCDGGSGLQIANKGIGNYPLFQVHLEIMR